jgi:hypothetical protein
MRAKIISMALVAAGASAALRADPPITTNFDFQKINSVIKEAMDPVIGTSSVISKLTYAIDPGHTDLDRDLYGIDMELTGKEPWSDETFTSKVKFVLQHDNADSKGNLNLFANLEVQTDTLALIRHHAERSKVCEMEEKLSGALRVAMAEDCKILPGLSKVQSFEELHQILRDHIDSAKIAMADYQADLTRAIDVVQGDLARESLTLELSQATRFLKGASDVRLTKTVDGVQLEILDFPVLGMLNLKNVQMDFSPAKIRAIAEVNMSVGTKLYRAMKPEFIQILQDLEGNQEYAKSLVQMETRVWLRLAEGHISGQGE